VVIVKDQSAAEAPYNWHSFKAYERFDDFLQSLIVERKSYITGLNEEIDFDEGFAAIKARFVDAYDESDATFDDKAEGQFDGASSNAKRLFANMEYLWCMPVNNVGPSKKRSYALRWFTDEEIVRGDSYFFNQHQGIANPGMWYMTNKYFEILTICRLFKTLLADSSINSINSAKQKIEQLAYEGIYGKVSSHSDFYTNKKCAAYHILLHLSNPDRYEAIVSEGHKKKIESVFSHVIAGDHPADREQAIQMIRKKLYGSHGAAAEPYRKRRWFFYMDDVKPLWIDKKSKKEQESSSISMEINEEATASGLEGEKEAFFGYRPRRDGSVVQGAKERDHYTCCACGFYYQSEVVHAHHLDPLSERSNPELTTSDHLVTLCPNCHYLAHSLLRNKKSGKTFKDKAILLTKLKSINTTLCRKR